MNSTDLFVDIQNATREHRARHGCGAYTFEDGPALRALAAKYLPARIVELGTALGYTACCMAGGSALAHVDTVEADVRHVTLARQHIARSALENRITVHLGKFEAALPEFLAGYDMAFFDGFAPPPETIAKLRHLLSPGGVLVCSNVQLAHGAAARELALELNNRHHWQPLAPIEGGRTKVLMKRGA